MANRDVIDGQSALDRLVAHYGIVPAYDDIWGRTHAASEETKRALLAAMGAAVSSDAEAEASLAAMRNAACGRLLPPVVVVEGEGPHAVPVWIPDGADGVLRWVLTDEAGSEWHGEANTSNSAATERCEGDRGTFVKREVALPIALTAGYYTLRAALGDGITGETSLIVAPGSCFAIEDAVGATRVWGVAAQLYGLSSERNWGIGDFVDLGDLALAAGHLGAATVGINPVHAGFTADPHHYSPYAPSTRIFLNYIYIDPASIIEYVDCTEAHALVEAGPVHESIVAARASGFVDYPAVAAAKLPVLRAVHRHFEATAANDRRSAFAAFRAEWGESLRRHSIFEALHAHHFPRNVEHWSWRRWPAALRDPGSADVAAFAEANAAEVDFFAWLQWVADEQLGAAQRQAHAAGMPIGIYRDLAVASDGGGSMAWSWPHVVLSGVSVGAPPDDLGPTGQNWGLSPLSPHGLREAAYRPFIDALRANMRHSGAVRIDHVMALTRLFWIPEGKTGVDGAYVRYPFEDLIRIVALESRRNRCIVIGEDLGTLPDGFREILQRFGVLSYRIMSFERDADGRLRPPEEYPEGALVAVATHDMPTVRGFWTGRDIEWRGRVVTDITDEWVRDGQAERRRLRYGIVDALRAANLDPGIDPDAAPTESLIEAVHRFIARTPARLLMVQLEDLLGLDEQANLPGTSTEHPNWRRRLPWTIGELFDHPQAKRILAVLSDERRH